MSNGTTTYPWEDEAFKTEIAAAGFPGSPQTDSAWLAGLYKFKTETTTPSAAPTLTALNPASTPANVDVTVAITGTGFDSGAKVMVGPTEVSPTGTPTPTAFSVLIPAADISIPGAVQISVKNGGGQTSNMMSLTLT